MPADLNLGTLQETATSLRLTRLRLRPTRHATVVTEQRLVRARRGLLLHDVIMTAIVRLLAPDQFGTTAYLPTAVPSALP